MELPVGPFISIQQPHGSAQGWQEQHGEQEELEGKFHAGDPAAGLIAFPTGDGNGILSADGFPSCQPMISLRAGGMALRKALP